MIFPKIRLTVKFKIGLSLIIFVWLIGSIIPLIPFFPKIFLSFSPFGSMFYSPVCHQESAKLICNDYGCTYLCSRCVGIYSGVFIFSFATIFIRNIKVIHIKYFFLLSTPLLVDVILSSSGFYPYSKTMAYLTGIIFGSTAFYYFYIGIQKWLSEKTRIVV